MVSQHDRGGSTLARGSHDAISRRTRKGYVDLRRDGNRWGTSPIHSARPARVSKGFELTSAYYPGCAAPTRDAHAVLIFLRDPLRFIDGRFRVPPQHPQYAHEDNVRR